MYSENLFCTLLHEITHIRQLIHCTVEEGGGRVDYAPPPHHHATDYSLIRVNYTGCPTLSGGGAKAP